MTGLWLNALWLPRLFAGRLLLALALLSPTLWLMHTGHGLMGWLCLPLALWPYRYRLAVSERGLEVGWLLVRGLVPRASITGVALQFDPRCWVIGTRQPVLRVSRQKQRDLLIFGPGPELGRLHDELSQLASA